MTSQLETNHQKTEAPKTKPENKCPISPTLDIEREAKQPCLSKSLKKSMILAKWINQQMKKIQLYKQH